MCRMHPALFAIFEGMWNTYFDTDFIGRHGERVTYDYFKSIRAIQKDAKYLRNVYLPTGNGQTTEVDLIVLTRRAVFVVETKNIVGDIYGDENSMYWQVVAGQENRQIYNPVKQNEGHLRALLNVIPLRHSYFSMVVFGKRANLKAVNIFSNHVFATYQLAIPSMVKQNWRKWRDVYTKEQIDEMYRKLLPYVSKNTSQQVKNQQLINAHRHK